MEKYKKRLDEEQWGELYIKSRQSRLLMEY